MQATQPDLFSLPPLPEPDPTPIPLAPAPVGRPAWLSTTWEHQLHHAGELCLISHAASGLLVAVVAGGEPVSQWHWSTLSKLYDLVDEVPPAPHLKNIMPPALRVRGSLGAAQLYNDFPALIEYARAYTADLGPSRRRSVKYWAG